MRNWVCFMHVAHAMRLIGYIAKQPTYWPRNYLMLRNEVTKANMRSEHFLTSTPLLKIWSAIMTSKILLDQLIFGASSSGLEVCIVTVNTKTNGIGTALWSAMEIWLLPTLFIHKEPFIWRLECHKIFISSFKSFKILLLHLKGYNYYLHI